MNFCDAHNHLQDERFAGRQSELLATARAAGVTRMVVNGSCEADWPDIAALAQEFPDLTMNATEYFARNCWISTECEDPFVSDVIRWLGDDHIVFETDFPHPTALYPNVQEHILTTLGDQSHEARRKVLETNAVKLYNLPF